MRRVLIVDDEMAVHKILGALVNWEALGFHAPVSAFSGEEALKLMRERRPDIVFADMNLPGMSGIEFMTAACEAYPETAFIIVSGYDSFDYARAAIRLRAVDYLLKPIDRKELCRAIGNAVATLPERDESERVSPADIASDIRAYIDKHYAEEIGVDALAEHFHFSREYLNRIFKKQFGCAVYEYVQTVRMDNAQRILVNTTDTIAEIAARLGYSSAGYFIKAFRKRFDISPGELRAQIEARRSGQN